MNDLEVESQSFKLQRFANGFFNYLHSRSWCPNFGALVICSLVQEGPSDFMLFREQHCYVKGLQTDIMGRSTAVGVPVTRAQLGYTEPYADILNFDTGSVWYGGNPVRLHDL